MGFRWRGQTRSPKVAFAVDGCLAAFEGAVAARAQLLFTHHGLFVGQPILLVGQLFARVRTLIEGRCGLYVAHLPLDDHPKVGNNVELARLLALKDAAPFGQLGDVHVGVGGTLDPPLAPDALADRLAQVTGEPIVAIQACGPPQASRVACVSGGAAFLFDRIAAAGFDTYVTGETSHSRFHVAAEHGLNVIYGGHYATETLGPKALARHLEEAFGLETCFLDLPTGM